MQIDVARDPYCTMFLQTKPTAYVVTDIIMPIPPTARELERSLQRRTSQPFVDAVSLSSFLNRPISFQEPLQMVSILRHFLGVYEK